MRLDHPIFHTPLSVDIELQDVAVPGNYKDWPDGRDLPDKIPAWKVNEVEFPKIDVGLVADPYGFEDSPDAEWISSGLNSKGPRSVALGRQANYFMWGFFGDPSAMTESARRVFVNTIQYMRQFDGRHPLVGKPTQSRDWAFVYAGYVRQFGKDPKSANDPKTKAFLEGLFDPEIKEAVGLDPDALEKYFRANLEYLHAGQQRLLAVDPDLVELQVSNRKLDFFEKLVQRLDDDPEDPVSLRLLERYATGLTTPGELAGWLEEHREALFFSDVGGFRWFLDPAKAKPEAARAGGDDVRKQ